MTEKLELLSRAQKAIEKAKRALKTNGNMDFNVKLQSANPTVEEPKELVASGIIPAWKHILLDGIHFHNEHDHIGYGTITQTSLCTDEFLVGNIVYFHSFNVIEIPTEFGSEYLLKMEDVLAYITVEKDEVK